MVWPLIIGAGAALGSALLGSRGAGNAAKTQARATDRATDVEERQFQQTRADNAPFRQVGLNALEQLTGRPANSRENFDASAYLAANQDVAKDKFFRSNPWEHYAQYGSQEGRQFTLNQDAQRRNFDPQAYLRANPDVAAAGVDPFQHYQEFGQREGRQFAQRSGELDSQVTPEEVMQDPGYQFGMQQGQQALDRKIAAMGGRVSGAALKAATRFGNDYASTGYNAAYQRKQDRMNRLAALAGIGQTATGSSAAAGGQAANAISGLISSQGDATAASQMARSNIWGNAGNQLAALYGRQQGNSAWANPSANPFSNRGGSFGSSGLDDFYYGNGSGGD